MRADTRERHAGPEAYAAAEKEPGDEVESPSLLASCTSQGPVSYTLG